MALYSRYIMNITKIIRRNISKMTSKSTPECSTKFLVSGLPGVQDDSSNNMLRQASIPTHLYGFLCQLVTLHP